MDDLVTWLRAQLDDDERAARRAGHFDDEVVIRDGWLSPANAEHLARWDPARVLAEVDAKRFVIDTLRGCEPNVEWDSQPDMGQRANNAAGALRRMALPYADRPGYLDEWKP